MARTQTPPRGRHRRALRWTAGLLAVALMPKCLVCLAAYVALATGLGTLGAEFCASPSAPGGVARLVTFDVWSISGLTLALCVAAVAWFVARRRRQSRIARPL